jgi:hypothetical protein
MARGALLVVVMTVGICISSSNSSRHCATIPHTAQVQLVSKQQQQAAVGLVVAVEQQQQVHQMYLMCMAHLMEG